MADGSRIPRRIVGFHHYFGTSYSYLIAGSPTAAARLQLLPADTTFMLSILTAWNPLMAKYADKGNGRTQAVIEQLNALIEKFVNYDRTTGLLNRIANSPTVSIADLDVFNIKDSYIRQRTRTVSHTVIADTIVASVTPLGGGQLAFKCRSHATGRATMCEGANSVQFCYVIGTAPEAPGLEGQNKEISTKASFTFVLDPSYAGKQIYVYFRWYNTKYPHLAGPWSTMYYSFIL